MTAREADNGKRYLPENLVDRIILVVVGLCLVLAVGGVWAEFLKPGQHRENTDAIVQDSRSIIAAAQRWYRSSSVVGGAQRSGWRKLNFAKLGMIDDAGGSPYTMTNANARFTIQVAEDGRSFDLIAEGRYGATVIYRGVTDAPPPEPEIR